MSKYISKVDKLVLISNTEIDSSKDVLSLMVGLYEGYVGGNSPYKFYNLNTSHSLGFLRLTGLKLHDLGSVKIRPRQECIFHSKDIESYVDTKIGTWINTFGRDKRLATIIETIEDDFYYLSATTNNVDTFKVSINRIKEQDGVYNTPKFSGSRESVYNALREDKYSYLFTRADIYRLKHDIKKMCLKLEDAYSSKIKKFEINKQNQMIVNDRRIV